MVNFFLLADWALFHIVSVHGFVSRRNVQVCSPFSFLDRFGSAVLGSFVRFFLFFDFLLSFPSPIYYFMAYCRTQPHSNQHQSFCKLAVHKKDYSVQAQHCALLNSGSLEQPCHLARPLACRNGA